MGLVCRCRYENALQKANYASLALKQEQEEAAAEAEAAAEDEEELEVGPLIQPAFLLPHNESQI